MPKLGEDGVHVGGLSRTECWCPHRGWSGMRIWPQQEEEGRILHSALGGGWESHSSLYPGPSRV